MSDTQRQNGGQSRRDQDKLAAALRENLKRRKAQARERRVAPAPDSKNAASEEASGGNGRGCSALEPSRGGE